MRDPWTCLAPRGWPRRQRPVDPEGNVLRVEGDIICPRCLQFIGPNDIVRRTAYGVVQHEHCPHGGDVPTSWETAPERGGLPSA